MQNLQVQQTTDYSKFKFLQGNRDINKAHAQRIKDSMENKTIISPILVNEKNEVIDGQHRLKALQELGKPVHYLKVNGYGLDEVQILNMNSKNWTTEAFLDSYVDLGYTEYIKFQEFKDSYDFNFSAALILAAGLNIRFETFRIGKFKFDDLSEAYQRADKVTMIKPYFDNYNHATFVRTMLQLFENENFEFSQFMSKLSYQPRALQIQQRVSQYLVMIEEIYNFKSRDKVSLRF